jgi:hypothetical protein
MSDPELLPNSNSEPVRRVLEEQLGRPFRAAPKQLITACVDRPLD